MKSILSVEARQHLVNLIPEIRLRNQFDDVTSELIVQGSSANNGSVDCNNEEANESSVIPQQFSKRYRTAY